MNQQDQIYIDSVQEQIKNGMYDHLFKGRKDLVFLDIGANIGLVSIYAVPFCKRIVSLEPDPVTFAQLKLNTAKYKIIEPDDFALAPKSGKCVFYRNDINFTASSTVNTYGEAITVSGITLTDYLNISQLTHVDVCKIDAEGAEGEALNLSQLESASGVIKQYYIETHNDPKTTWEHKLGTIVGNLARCGYSEMQISGMAITATRP